MLREHFPGVLNAENVGSSSKPASNSSARPASTPPSNHSSYVFDLSLDPDHLTLNLRIQSFIEAVRTRPLAPPPPPTSYLTSHHALSLSPYDTPSPSPSPPSPVAGSITTTSEDQKNVVLHLGKELLYIAHTLPDPTDRAVYLKELDSIWALIAYPDPEGSAPPHVSKYLQYDRRLTLADQINSAILCAFPSLSLLRTACNSTRLYLVAEILNQTHVLLIVTDFPFLSIVRTGFSPRSALESYVRCTGAVWNTISEKNVQIPTDPKHYPPGVQPPPPSRPSRTVPINAVSLS